MPHSGSKPTIAVDIDDVLAAHIDAFVGFSNQHFGTKLTPEGYSEHWSTVWGVDHAEVQRRALKFHTPERVGGFGVIEEAGKVLRALKNQRNLVIVTARPKHIIDTTNQWLKRHFDGVFSEVHFVPIWEPDNTVTKADICKNIGADYLIDDLVRHCNLAAENGIKALLFGNYGWKQPEEKHPEIVTVKNWREVQEYFNAEG